VRVHVESGYLPRRGAGRIDKDLARIAYELEGGEVSSLVRGRFGCSVIRREKEDPRHVTFKEIREKVAHDLLNFERARIEREILHEVRYEVRAWPAKLRRSEF